MHEAGIYKRVPFDVDSNLDQADINMLHLILDEA